MSFDINAINPARNLRLAPERPAARAAGAGADAGFAGVLKAADVTVDAIPSAPPPEVMDEVLAASARSRRCTTAAGRCTSRWTPVA